MNRNDRVKLVIGGTKLKKEISKMGKYLSYLAELKKASKIASISDQLVDSYEEKLVKKVNKKDFDDPHFVALLAISGCLIFVSHDFRSEKYIKRTDFYPTGSKPSIYKRREHSTLLTDERIVKLKNIE